MTGPLSHIRVLDFTALVQGPMATQIFGDLGADVIKFERPGGEWMRHWGILNGMSHGEMDSFLAFNRNKRSVAVDLKDPAVRTRILELALEADVVVENFRAGVMGRRDKAVEQVREMITSSFFTASIDPVKEQTDSADTALKIIRGIATGGIDAQKS
jgi:crotonobetainyl-CoA:carnitine CoA-transferase CaiB-like acyl-CoA transferase